MVKKIAIVIGILTVILIITHFLLVFLLPGQYINFLKNLPGLPGFCVGEGKTGSGWENERCCLGLSSHGQSLGKTRDGTCIAILDASFICTNCGDGICGPGEEECTCEEDYK